MEPKKAVALVDLLRHILLRAVRAEVSVDELDAFVTELRDTYTKQEIVNAIKAIFGR